MRLSKTSKIVNTINESKKQDHVLYDTWNFFVGKESKQVRVCVHLDMKEIPTQEMVVKQLVMYLYAFEGIKKRGTYSNERTV